MKKLWVLLLAFVLLFGILACQGTTTTTDEVTTATTSATATSTGAPTTTQGQTTVTTVTTEEPIVYGLPEPEQGFYMRDADIIQDNDMRLLVYTTNKTSGDEENVIAIRQGDYDSTNGYAYGEEHVIIEGSASGWDQYLGSASIVEGVFEMGGTTYDYLIAYSGTESINDTSFSIGLAVTNDPLGTWVKVGSSPVISYDSSVYGSSYTGYYAPSLVNLDKESIIRVFYTWADAYGHFSYFVDIDASDLDSLDPSGFAMVPNNGNLSSGEDVTMVPNGDFAYDAVNGYFYMIKDYSPSASQEPRVATRIELARIAENELYVAPNLNGWESLRVYDFEDTPGYLYERLYSGTIVSDSYGHLLDVDSIEIVYNTSDLAVDNPNYIYSQHLETFIYTSS